MPVMMKLDSGRLRERPEGSNKGLDQKRKRWRTPVAHADYAQSVKIYDRGLHHVRRKKYNSARRVLMTCAKLHPTFERAWVTLAQVEKKNGQRDECERILKDGLAHNPQSSAILQAWGLHLLQEEDPKHDIMAYGLLQSAVKKDPSKRGVLKWKRVRSIGHEWARVRQARMKLRQETASTETVVDGKA